MEKTKYKIREKKKNVAAYISLISTSAGDELYDKILNIIIVQKKYKLSHYTLKDLAKELNANHRYVSAVISSHFNMNYPCVRNVYRIKEAMHLLSDPLYSDKNIKQIGTMVGFANRECFYAAFYKNLGMTPNEYRMKHLKKAKK